MTNEQLKKLAEIAGIYPLDEVEVLGRTAFYAWVPTPFNQFVRSEWLPHVQIEQAMMVVNGIPEERRYHYIDELKKIVPLHSDGWYLINATASQRCTAALAIGG